MDTFNAVTVFVACVESGGFAKAGCRLGISRSAVGKTIAKLEQKLGVRLFQRTTRSLRLTEDGQVYFESARRALADLEAAETALEQGRCEPIGQLRITAPTSFGRLCVAPVLLELAQAHPQLAITMNFSDRPSQLVEDGFNLAVRVSHSAQGSGLMVRKLATFEMVLCAGPRYIERCGVPTSVKELEHHERIVFHRVGGSSVWELADGAGDWIAFSGGQSRIVLDNLEATADAVLNGYGIAWLPSWLVGDHIRAGRLSRLLPHLPGLKRNISAIWPRSPFMPSRLRLAVDALASRLPVAIGG